MKVLFLILTTLFLLTSASAQDSIALKQQYRFQYLNDSTTNRIDFGCGYFGDYSDNLYFIRKLIFEKRFDLITKLLDSKTASTRYLAAISLIRADKKKFYRLDSLTTSKIEILRHDQELIPFCSGCTGHWSISIKALLNRRMKVSMAKWTKRWIDESFKKGR